MGPRAGRTGEQAMQSVVAGWRRRFGGLTAVTLLAFGASSAGCSASDEDSPEAIVRSLFRAAEAGDVEAMVKCYSPAARESASGYLAGLADPEAKARFMERMKKIEKLDLTVAESDGQQAKVLASIHIDGKVERETFRLALADGAWRID